MINLALLGAGRIGSIHGRNARQHPDVNLVGLFDPYSPNADQLANELGCDQLTLDDAFDREDIDGILICSATDTHADFIERAANAGKHVFCEKPVDLSLERVQACIDRVSGSTRAIMVAFNRRFDPNFSALQHQIAQGAIGEIELVNIISKDPGPPPVEYIQVSGGLFRDMTIHDFDMARYLLGESITSVSAEASCLVDAGIAEAGDSDTAIVNMTSVNGKLVQISNSRRANYGYDQRIEVHGSKGLLIAENVNEHTLSHYDQQGKHSAKPLYFFLERYEAAYRRELSQFIQHIGDPSANPIPTLEDGLQSLRLAEAAIQSNETGRRIRMDTIN